MSDPQTAMTRRPANAVADQNELKSLVESKTFMDALGKVLPKHLTAERMAKMAILAATRTPKIFQCLKSQEGKLSILKAVMDAGSYGLDCSGLGGRGYIVPFDDRRKGVTLAQFIPGYRGLMDVARNSGMVQTIWAEVVYAADDFSYDKGENTLHHADGQGDKSDRNIIGAYARARLKNCPLPETRYLTRADIEKHRAKSKASNNGPWVTDYAAMCRKTALLVLCRDLPQSPEMLKLTEQDREAEDLTEFTVREEPDPNADLVGRLMGAPEDGAPSTSLAEAHGKPAIEQEMPPSTPNTQGTGKAAETQQQASAKKAPKKDPFAKSKPARVFDAEECGKTMCGNVIIDENAQATGTHIDCNKVQVCPLEAQNH